MFGGCAVSFFPCDGLGKAKVPVASSGAHHGHSRSYIKVYATCFAEDVCDFVAQT